MRTSIGRSLRVLSFLLGSLALSVIGGRAEQYVDAGHGRLPPIPKKGPVTGTTVCPPCAPMPTVTVGTFTVTSDPYWFDGEIYQVKIFFGNDAARYKAFGSQTVSLCYQSGAAGVGSVQWSLDNNRKRDLGGSTYVVIFRACRPKDDQGTGTGRIIVTGPAAVGDYCIPVPGALQTF